MYHVRINKNQVLWKTKKAVLVKFPRSNTWKFWVPKKLLQENQKGLIMLLPDSMEIKLISDAGSHKHISHDEFLERFGFSFDFLEDLEDD